MLDHVGVTARVTYALVVGYAVLPALAAEPNGQDLARRALSDGECRLAGAPVSARALTDLLMDEREEGLVLHEQRCTDPVRRHAWTAIGTAVAYLAWQAWRAEGRLPDPLVSEVDDDTLDLLSDQAVDAGVPAPALQAVRERIESSADGTPTIAELLGLIG
jgi:hypothetical protein